MNLTNILTLLSGGVKSRVLTAIIFQQTSACVLSENMNSERHFGFFIQKKKQFKL